MYLPYVKLVKTPHYLREDRINKKFKEKPKQPHDLVERFSCNSDEAEYMLEKCIYTRYIL